MKVDLKTEIPSKQSIKSSESDSTVYYVVYLIPLFLICVFVFFETITTFTNLPIALAALAVIIWHIGIIVVNAIQKFIHKFIEPITDPLFFIERSFEVYKQTIKADFFVKNNRCYLALLHKNSIEIYDVKNGQIVIEINTENNNIMQELDANYQLLIPCDKFIVTYSKIVDNRSKTYLIKLWDMNTYDFVFSCKLGDIGSFLLSKNRKFLLLYNKISERKYEYDEGYWEWYNYYHNLKIWEINSGQLIYNHCFLQTQKNTSYKEVKAEIKEILKSYKDVGELDESDEKENISLPYAIAIIFPSCTKNYHGHMEYDMTKVGKHTFTEKATYIRAKIPKYF